LIANPGGQLRVYTILSFVFATILLVLACSKSTPPQPIVKITNGAQYFPLQQLNKWIYNTDAIEIQISGDTTVNGVDCFRILKNGELEEAWTLTPARFAQHLLLGFLWFQPPLDIPLDLEKDKPHQVSSLGLIAPGYSTDIDSARFAGTLAFAGYTKRTIHSVDLDSCIQLHYNVKASIYFSNQSVDTGTSIYDEYYARGIGLIQSISIPPSGDDRFLDMAIIDGDTLPSQH
jgi:hypothetical protein